MIAARKKTVDVEVSLDELDDNDLLSLTRAGSSEAYAALYDRYVYGARRLARHLGQREESEDVVAEAFAQVFDLLQRGKGPDRAFRAYLFTSIRHESGRRAKANQRVMPTDDDAAIDSAVPFGDGQLDDFEKTAVRAAYESLPDRWRTVLWHLDVEGRKPHEIADAMGLKANSVSALVYRARSGLREAYLQQHVNTAAEPDDAACAEVRGMLAAVVRRTATMRDQERVHAHLERCEACIAVYVDLQEVGRDVGSIAAPVAIGSVVAGGSVLSVVGGGGTVLTQLVAGAKAVLVAAGAPAAAAVTTLAVVAGSASSPAAAAPTGGDEVRPAVSARATPKPLMAKPARAAVDTRQHRAPSPSVPTVAAPTGTPTVVAAAPAHESPVGVAVTPEAVHVKVGPVAVTTKPVTDLVGKVVPVVTTAVTDLLAPR